MNQENLLDTLSMLCDEVLQVAKERYIGYYVSIHDMANHTDVDHELVTDVTVDDNGMLYLISEGQTLYRSTLSHMKMTVTIDD